MTPIIFPLFESQPTDAYVCVYTRCGEALYCIEFERSRRSKLFAGFTTEDIVLLDGNNTVQKRNALVLPQH